MELGRTVSGVSISRSITGESVMPMTVSSAPATKPNASSVWMVFCMRS